MFWLGGHAAALEFSHEEWRAALNTELGISAGWRMDSRDRRLLGQGNQNIAAGTRFGSPTGNTDDGSWNFDKSETYSKLFHGRSELSLSWRDFGAVASARYFYDVELKDEARAKDDTGYARSLNDETLDAAGADAELMDAYVYGRFESPRPASFKLGQHTLSWGEGLFMPGGINVINPIDVAAARAPGSEVKDFLLPVNMVSGSLALSRSVSLEAFYQLEWEASEQEPCGSYFSSNDTSADGCGPIVLLNVSDADAQALISGKTAIVPRLPDREASDHGQYGIALHWFLEQFNGSELGVYFMNYHSRLPYFSGVALDPFQTAPTDLLPVVGLPSYYSEYPEDIRLYGLSLSTTSDSGFSFAGEYSFRENEPVQWNSSEIVYGGLLRLHSRHLLERAEQANKAPIELAGTEQPGYDRYKTSQLQLSTIKLMNDFMETDFTTFVAEIGGVYIHDFPNSSRARYGRPAQFGNGSFEGLGQEVVADINPFSPVTYSCTGEGAFVAANDNPAYCDNQGYTTQFSWGYILGMQMNYQAVWPNINLQPEVFFSHDVNGYSPEPLGLFVEGRKKLGLTLKADYWLSRYQGALGFVKYYGGGRHNVLNDRDHFTASLSVSF